MEPRPGPYIRAVVGASLLMMSLTLVVAGTAYFVVPVTEELGVSRGAFLVHFSLFTIVALVSLPVMGKVAGRHGVRPLVFLGGTVAALALAGMALSNSLVGFYVLAVLAGFTVNPTSMLFTPTLVTAWFERKRGTMLGISIGAGGLGGVLASAVLPPFIESNGWRAGYLLVATLYLTCVLLAGVLIRSRPENIGLRPWGAGTGADGPTDPENPGGVPYRTALKSPEFWLIFLGVACFMGVASGQEHYPAHMSDQGMTPAGIAGVMSVYFLVALVALPSIGFLTDRFGIVRTMITVWIVGATGWGLLLLGGSPLFLGLGVYLLLAPAANSLLPPLIARQAFGARDNAGILGVILPAGTVGIATGAPLWGVVHDMTGSYGFALLGSPVVMGLGFLIAIFALKRAQATYRGDARSAAEEMNGA